MAEARNSPPRLRKHIGDVPIDATVHTQVNLLRFETPDRIWLQTVMEICTYGMIRDASGGSEEVWGRLKGVNVPLFAVEALRDLLNDVLALGADEQKGGKGFVLEVGEE